MANLTRKRRMVWSSKAEYRDWSIDMHSDLLDLVLNKLSFPDIMSFRAVCSSWRLAAKSHSSYFPMLIMAGAGIDEENPDGNSSSSCRFISLPEKKLYELKDKSFEDAWCVGSSSGWLVFLDNTATSHLFNPFSRETIRLPLITTLPGKPECPIRRYSITKAVVLGDPHYSVLGKKNKNKKTTAWVIVIHGPLTKNLAYCGTGDESWTRLNGLNDESYTDILCHNGNLYALSSLNCVEVWDFKSHSLPQKTMNFVPHIGLHLTLDGGKTRKDKYFINSYLVESMGEFLMVTRFIGNLVNGDGELLDEVDLLTDEDTHPLVCPYRTVSFQVHKMDLRTKNWEKVDESLGDRALFVGGNESMAVSTRVFPECEGNSIYFTDDIWDEMYGDYLFGGHDNGVYNLKAKVIKPYYDFDDDKVDPAPFWIVPNLGD